MSITVNINLRANSISDAIGIIEGIQRRAVKPPMQKTLRNAAEYVRLRTLANFMNSEDPDGNPWAPLKYRKGRILVKTGLLFTQAVAAGSSPVISDDSLLISVPEPTYGIFHLTGTRNMPARPWLGLNEKMVEEIGDGAAKSACGCVEAEP